MPMKIVIGALQNKTFPGKLTMIAPKGKDNNGTIKFPVEGDVYNPNNEYIRAGFSANGEIVLKSRKNALLLDESLIQYEKVKGKDKPFVEVKQTDGKFRKAYVTLGASDGINVEILSGLSKDDEYALISPEYELHRDEYLHLDQANHLAWGYLSVPPVTSWLAWIIRTLGNDVFWVKFFPALFGALTIALIWKTVEALNGNLFAKVLASTVIKYINSEKIQWLYVAAAVFGIGILNKYNIAFSVLGLIPAFLLTEHRKIFRNRHLYWAALLVLIIVFPNLFWQYRNNFPVVHHMKELSESQLVHVSRMNFLKAQVLFFTGSIFVIIAAKDYYAIGLYPVYIAFGAVFLSHLFDKGRARFFKPDPYRKFGLLRWEDGNEHSLPQDFADMQGWRELARKVDQEYAGLSKQEER
ncbi:hypothetical protein COLO4_01141 [Corchorus olitorius]|uniref:Uncharacterized protein n=1 Tax=Corchorus olitorius TaxID=93759 RepID=A0A1R3L2Y2_9ROSI|nr:hypothetical protein COLO4_01141 [Corchorus olitorius]